MGDEMDGLMLFTSGAPRRRPERPLPIPAGAAMAACVLVGVGAALVGRLRRKP